MKLFTLFKHSQWVLGLLFLLSTFTVPSSYAAAPATSALRGFEVMTTKLASTHKKAADKLFQELGNGWKQEVRVGSQKMKEKVEAQEVWLQTQRADGIKYDDVAWTDEFFPLDDLSVGDSKPKTLPVARIAPDDPTKVQVARGAVDHDISEAVFHYGERRGQALEFKAMLQTGCALAHACEQIMDGSKLNINAAIRYAQKKAFPSAEEFAHARAADEAAKEAGERADHVGDLLTPTSDEIRAIGRRLHELVNSPNLGDQQKAKNTLAFIEAVEARQVAQDILKTSRPNPQKPKLTELGFNKYFPQLPRDGFVDAMVRLSGHYLPGYQTLGYDYFRKRIFSAVDGTETLSKASTGLGSYSFPQTKSDYQLRQILGFASFVDEVELPARYRRLAIPQGEKAVSVEHSYELLTQQAQELDMTVEVLQDQLRKLSPL